MKKCRRCLTERHDDEFGEYTTNRGKKVRRLTCKYCMNVINSENRHKLIGKRFDGMTLKCRHCEETKPITEFEPGRAKCNSCRSDGRRRATKSSKDEIRKATEWNRENPERHRINSLAYYYRLQHAAINAYGGYRCACCGETEPLFLELDHVNQDGKHHRKMLGTLGGAKLYKWLRDNSYPEGFQVLCSNCNKGRARNGGVCPHHRKCNDHPERE